MRRTSIVTVALIGAAGLIAPMIIGGSASAATLEAGEEPTPMSETAGLYFAGFDVQRAAAYGYDVRTNEAGLQYAVPTGTAVGSMEGAMPTFDPARFDAMRSGDHSAGVEAEGDCGTADLDLDSNTTGTTAYHLNGKYGAALFHTWGVSLISSIDAGNVPLDGAAPVPGLSFDWDTRFDHEVQAIGGTTLSAVAGGTVTTVLGECFSGAPHSAIRYR